MQNIIAPIEKQILQKEIDYLPESDYLTSRKEFEVYLTKSQNIPNTLKEIGRLREITFRSVGEGTGKSVDLDKYDEHFSNLFIWDKKNQKIVGSYRVGFGKEIFKNVGLEGFYINSLFCIHEKALPILNNSIELGRSFVVEEYQKSLWSLFLLWKGIIILLSKKPEYQYLIGPVSISKNYPDFSKSLIVAFAKKFYWRNDFAPYFKAKTPYTPDIEGINLENISVNTLKDLEKILYLSDPILSKLPPLIKQYIRVKARFLSFNLDPNFSDALDGLIIVNQEEIPESIFHLLLEK